MHLIVGEVDVFVEESNRNKYLVLISEIKIKKHEQNAQNIGMQLKMILNDIIWVQQRFYED